MDPTDPTDPTGPTSPTDPTDPYPIPPIPTERLGLLTLIQNKIVELMPLMYPGLPPAQIGALWDNFGNANPAIRQEYLLNNIRLMTENPAETEENALFIINSGVSWIKNRASSFRGNPLTVPTVPTVPSGGKRRNRKTRRSRSKNMKKLV
jgi:hypothetical protein